MGFLTDVLVQGLLYGVLAIGVMLSYEVLDIPDLSVDGTFPLGVVVSAILIVKGINPWLALLVSFLAGVLAGAVTGILHVKMKISALLSGILVMSGLYSINLMIAKGSSNIPLFQFDNIFTPIQTALPSQFSRLSQLITMIIVVVVVKVCVDKILKTNLGYLFKVTGDNPNLITSLGHDKGWVKIIGLGLANGLVALSGGLAASVEGYFDISLGTGMMILGLSSVILGTIIFKRFKLEKTTTAVLGAIVYRFIIAIALRLNMNPQLLKLATVIIFISALLINDNPMSTQLRKKMKAS
ncbi:ABC transporter permease [Erysipelothrix urinaevulpis]|uniref:ABC transporter permease n=1 Tax=Erysipelothrix urinaevulpis TaxID=2683717 RepID=UPI001358ED23|nr:ABC transporter permease [Erysipelothrix urinaevulpis]